MLDLQKDIYVAVVEVWAPPAERGPEGKGWRVYSRKVLRPDGPPEGEPIPAGLLLPAGAQLAVVESPIPPPSDN